jgi:hypothetical protein
VKKSEIDDKVDDSEIIELKPRRRPRKPRHISKTDKSKVKPYDEYEYEYEQEEVIENFEGEGEGDYVMSPRDKKLFDAIRKGKLSDDEVNDLINSGVITENLVERFLQKIEKETFANPGPELLFRSSRFGGTRTDGPIIQPFTGGTYASLY